MIKSSRILLGILSLFGFGNLGVAASMEMKSEILGAYVKISAALAADDLKAAQAAATEVAGHADMAKNNGVADLAKSVAGAADIAAARESFKALSTAVEPLAAGEKDYVVMHCPMAKAEWVQAGTAVKNPYYGKSMLTCGGPKKGAKSGMGR